MTHNTINDYTELRSFFFLFFLFFFFFFFCVVGDCIREIVRDVSEVDRCRDKKKFEQFTKETGQKSLDINGHGGECIL